MIAAHQLLFWSRTASGTAPAPCPPLHLWPRSFCRTFAHFQHLYCRHCTSPPHSLHCSLPLVTSCSTHYPASCLPRAWPPLCISASLYCVGAGMPVRRWRHICLVQPPLLNPKLQHSTPQPYLPPGFLAPAPEQHVPPTKLCPTLPRGTCVAPRQRSLYYAGLDSNEVNSDSWARREELGNDNVCEGF